MAPARHAALRDGRRRALDVGASRPRALHGQIASRTSPPAGLGSDEGSCGSRRAPAGVLPRRPPEVARRSPRRARGGGRLTAGSVAFTFWRASARRGSLLGPLLGRQQMFVLLEEWEPPGRVLDRDEALAQLAGRYFAGHGPATLRTSSGGRGSRWQTRTLLSRWPPRVSRR